MVGFDGYNEQARRVFSHAQDEARTLRHGAIGSGHLLLALMQAKGSAALEALESLGLTEPTVRRRVEAVMGRGDHPSFGRILFDEQVEKILGLAQREARVSGQDVVAPEHLLLGLLRVGHGVGAAILKELGVDAFALRRRLRDLAGQTPAAADPGGVRQGALVSLLAARAGGATADAPTSGGWEVLDRLTDSAWGALLRAREQAVRLDHQGVDAEHLLAGALTASDGLAAAALAAAGGSRERLAARLEQMLGRGDERQAGYLPFTPLAKLVLGLAGLEARRRDQETVTTGDILMALLQAHAPATEGLLRRAGADPGEVSAHLDRLLNERAAGERPA